MDARSDISTRDDLQRLVVDFYRDVAMDDVLGPIFAAARVDWSVHIPKLTDFWAWQLLGEAVYERNPLRAHEPVHTRTPFGDEHYQRWLELFETSVDDSFAGPVAEMAKAARPPHGQGDAPPARRPIGRPHSARGGPGARPEDRSQRR